MKPICAVYHPGVMDYEEAWQLQGRLAGEIAAGSRKPCLLLLQHPHTYTFGRRGHAENLLWDEPELARRDLRVYWVDRGGDVTYHGPGQLVGYPLIPLGTGGLSIDPASGTARLPQVDYVGYVRNLEKTLILALAWLGVTAWQVTGMTGVWVENSSLSGEAGRSRAGELNLQPDHNLAETPPAGAPISNGSTQKSKIAAIGVKVDAQGVTRHGFALNVNPDMSYWEGIIGCGLAGHPVTSLAELLQPHPSMEAVTAAVIKAFGSIFQYEMVDEAL